jgi:hypothetical protein
MLLGTGSNATISFSLHFSVEMKIMHHRSRHLSGFPESLLVPHGTPVISRRMASRINGNGM